MMARMTLRPTPRHPAFGDPPSRSWQSRLRCSAWSHRLVLACGIALASAGVAAFETCALLPDEPMADSLDWSQERGAGSTDEERGASCLIEADKASDEQAQRSITWVDVRGAASIRRNPLPGVVEIPLADLPGKSFLRNERLILVGSGFDGRVLLESCRRLRAEGWRQVSVLHGGVRRWHAPLPLGDQVAVDELLQSPLDSHWRIVSVGLDEAALSNTPPRASIALPDSQRSTAQLITAVDGLRHAAQAGGLSTIDVLIVASGHDATNRLRQTMAQAGSTKNVYWLEGGLAALRQYLKQQQRIAFAAGRSLKSPCGAL